MKKILVAVLLVVSSLTLFGCGGKTKASVGGKATDKSAFTYEVQDGGITITGLTDSSIEKIVVPYKIDGKVVKRIGDEAFAKSSVKEAYLDGTDIERMDSAIFSDDHMETCVYPDTLKYLAETSIAGCENSVHLPSSLAYLKIEKFSQLMFHNFTFDKGSLIEKVMFYIDGAIGYDYDFTTDGLGTCFEDVKDIDYAVKGDITVINEPREVTRKPASECLLYSYKGVCYGGYMEYDMLRENRYSKEPNANLLNKIQSGKIGDTFEISSEDGTAQIKINSYVGNISPREENIELLENLCGMTK